MKKQQKSLLFLLALLALSAGAAAYAYFGVLKAEETEQKQKEGEAKAFPFDKEAVKRISLTAKGETTVLERSGDGWSVVAPVSAKADKFAADALAERLASLKSTQTIADEQSRAAEYGLDSPSFVVSVVYTDAGAEKSAELKVGGESPMDQSLYFSKGGDTRVLLAESNLRYALDKGLFDLRDKGLVSVDPKSIQSVSVEASGLAWRAERAGEGWKLTSPVQDAGDATAIEGVLSRLGSVRAKAFVAEGLSDGAPELKPFGLNSPAVLVTLESGPDKARTVVQVGRTVGEGGEKAYARLAGTGPVLEVEEALLKDLAKGVNDVRDRTVAPFSREKARKIEIAPLEGEKVTLLKSVTPTVDGGSAADSYAVEGRSGKVLSWKASSALYTLSTLKGLTLVDEAAKDLSKYGLTTPNVVFTVRDEAGGELARLLVGAQAGTHYYAMKAGSARVYEVEKGTVDDIPRKADDYLEKAPEAAAAPKADSSVGK